MTRTEPLNLISSALFMKFSSHLTIACATMLLGALAAFPTIALAQDTWAYCITIDKQGHRARFTNLLHFAGPKSELELTGLANKFKSEIGSDYNAAARCLVFKTQAAAERDRNINISAIQSIGSTAYVKEDYNVSYPGLVVDAPEPVPVQPSKTGQRSTDKAKAPDTNTAVNQPKAAPQSQARGTNNSGTTRATQPVPQVRPGSRPSTQESIRRAQEKTKRINRARAASNSSQGKTKSNVPNQYAGAGRDYRVSGDSGSFLKRSMAVDLAGTAVENKASDLCGVQSKAEITWGDPVCRASTSENDSYRCSVDATVNCYVRRCPQPFCGTGRKSIHAPK